MLPRSVYIYIFLLSGVNLWELIFIQEIFNPVTMPVFSLVWALFGIYHYRNQPEVYQLFDFRQYRKYYLWFFAGIFLSIIPAYLFWNQDLLTSLIVNRGLIIYAFIPVLFIIKPSDQELMKGIVMFTITYMIIWTVQAMLVPIPLTIPFLERIKSGAPFEIDPTDFGKLLPGYTIILLLFYMKLQQFREKPSVKTLFFALIIYAVIFLLQNRGTLFFASGVLIYVVLRLKSRFRPYLLLAYGIGAIAILYFTADMWISMISETSNQAGDLEYNRWKALGFFLTEYSPDWLCYILGNGKLSFHTNAGVTTLNLTEAGFDQSDIGIVGFWSLYGIIPVIVIYLTIGTVLKGKVFPFYLKVLALHMLLIPIAWNFAAADAVMLIMMIYLTGYYSISSEFDVNSIKAIPENGISNP